MQAVIDACRRGYLNAKPQVVISNNSKSDALSRAKAENIAAYYLSSKTHPDSDELDGKILRVLSQH